MAPRRSSGGSSSSYSSYYNNPWSEETEFSLRLLRSKSLFIAGFAFDVLTILALIGFLVWACLVHNGRGQLKGVFPALLAYLASMLTILVYEIFFFANATVQMYYLIDLMLNEFFFMVAGCLIFFVFYHLIHSALDRLTDAGKPYAIVAIIHWVILGLVSVVSLATFGLYVGYQVQNVQNYYYSKLAKPYNNLEAARAIIWWLLSLEIVAWFIFIVVKASHRFASKLPIFSLLGGSIAWMALNLAFAVIYIRYSLEGFIPPNYLSCVQSVLQFFFIVGTFVGILLACMKWRSVDDREDKNMVAQYPYGAGQYQSYQAYQQQNQAQMQQQYPQQYYQQPYPQPAQQAYQQPVAQHAPKPEQVRSEN
ncbi:hypothetical protein PEBR_12272 [Penicillium brasilianum]|uniref:Integral membrane protein n=1 Tax=Penicillium brasilianum TaxID=104259 RepID=A0A1S9RSI6_PENBI|nr:hypothetical protein PEBR_12272 [Penicillium brasilianum]